MPVTQSLNSKANIKKTTNQDLPFSPQQPVISSYYATSTLSQTIINLSFSVDQSSTDIFWLFVDGKKLRLGSTNDYTFTSIAADNTSSQVTLNFALPANLNIQAFKLGLKAEVEFQTDNRFINLYDYLENGFQPFVNTKTLMNPTTTVGTPAAGSFYSTITKRESIIDLSQDLKSRMAVDRMAIQSIYQLQKESGPNGEAVWGVANDTFGQIRLVGDFTIVNGAYGPNIAGSASNTTDYIEVTFYGTGLNLLNNLGGAGYDIRYSVDGGAESANVTSGTYSNIIFNRQYTTNQVLPVVSGLTLGVHTVKIRQATAGSLGLQGVEVLNSSASVITNPGFGFAKSGKITLAAQNSFTYNADSVGTRGGRVVTYLSGTGVSRAYQQVNTSSAFLTSASHTNEDIARVYSVREFGAGRADDFSTLTSTSSANRAFTLDDDTTTLMGNAVLISSGDTLSMNDNTSNITFTFVGTGLDVLNAAGGGVTMGAVFVDGTNVGNYVRPTNGNSILKICSGLPYGTHTVRFTQVAGGGAMFSKLIVYQPKKPTIPSGTVELADYNIMANYTANTSAGPDFIAPGVLRKHGSREFLYVGTYTAALDTTTTIGGWSFGSTTNADTIRYSFFGTGFELRAAAGTSLTYTINVDGSTNLSGFTTSAYGTNNSIAPGTGTVTQSGAGQNGQGVTVNGLTLGLHTVILTKTSGTSALAAICLDIVTPIHSHKSNLNYDQQNTMTVGSQGIADIRALTPIKDDYLQKKNISQAVGTISNPTTTATAGAPVPLPDMSVVHYNKTGKIKISATVVISGGTAGGVIIGYVDGLAVTDLIDSAVTSNVPYTFSKIVNVTPGFHKVDVYWGVGSGGTITAVQLRRNLLVEDV